jgi:hypothetical protein
LKIHHIRSTPSITKIIVESSAIAM